MYRYSLINGPVIKKPVDASECINKLTELMNSEATSEMLVNVTTEKCNTIFHVTCRMHFTVMCNSTLYTDN